MEQRRFEEFYRSYMKRVYKFVFFRVGSDKRLAEDLTQDVFLKAFEAFERYDPAVSQSSWIYTIARNHLINHYAKSRPGVSFDDIEGSVWTSEDGRIRMIRRQEERSVLDALARLSKEDAVLIRMKYLEGWQFDELAEIFGKSSGSLRVQAGRAMKQLKTEMKKI